MNRTIKQHTRHKIHVRENKTNILENTLFIKHLIYFPQEFFVSNLYNFYTATVHKHILHLEL